MCLTLRAASEKNRVKPKRKHSPLEATAYHEAGHAVAAYWLRRAFRHVTIAPDLEGGSLGHMLDRKLKGEWIPDAEPERYRSRFEKMIIVSMAGAEAERKFTGRYNRIGASGDRKDQVDYGCWLTAGDLDEVPLYLDLLKHRTRRLLEAHHVWFAVEVLAKELLKRETIRWKDAKEIIRQAMFDSGARVRVDLSKVRVITGQAAQDMVAAAERAKPQ